MNINQLVAALIANDGAVLSWQVDAPQQAIEQNLVCLDGEFDLLIHKDAVRVDETDELAGYTMPTSALRQWYTDEIGYDPMQDDPSMPESEFRQLCVGVAKIISGSQS